MSSVVMKAYRGATILGSATLNGNSLAWSSVVIPWGDCDGLELCGSVVQSLWLVVEKSSVSLSGKNFPQNFNIVTPFFNYVQCSLSQSNGIWTLSGNIAIAQVPDGVSSFQSFALPINSSSPLDSKILNLKSVGFTSSPQDYALIADNPQSTNVRCVFVPQADGGQSYYLYVSAPLLPDGSFFNGLPPIAHNQYTVNFTYRSSDTGPSAYLELAGFDPASVADYWTMNIAGPYLIGLRATEVNAPISLLFTLPDPAATPVWYYRAQVEVTTDGVGRTVTWGDSCTFSFRGMCRFQAPNFCTHDGTALQISATSSTTVFPDQLDSYIDNWDELLPGLSKNACVLVFVFCFDGGAQALPGQRVRLGALDLAFSEDSATSPVPSLIPPSMFGYLAPSVSYIPRGALMLIPQVTIQSLVLGAQAQVGSQDPLPDEDDSTLQPIVIAQANETTYVLQITEQNLLSATKQNSASSRSLDLQLYAQNGEDGGPVELTVLDQTPLLVAKVQLPSLLGSGSGSSRLVAEWNSNFAGGPVWQTQSGAQQVTVLLPPQGVGEQMESKAGQIGESSLVDYLFTPPASLQITPPLLSSQAGNFSSYFQAPWNLRWLTTSPGQEIPGCFVPLAAAEFFYGLPVTVNGAGIRLAELSALTGQLASPVPTNALLYNDDGWGETLTAFQTRLSALALWDGVDPTALTLTNSAQYSLRQNADSYYQFDPSPGTHPYPPAGTLKGGVGWLFETEGEWAPLWQKPISTSAMLANPVFSALGGWAKQRAVFLNGVVTINAQVEMGRTSTVSLEILGRIGVFWNHAKLVIVYERTVEPSEQFEGTQDALLGRPILRKVAEYVELLEPIRQYPESGTAAINTACIEGIEFKSKIIYVDSAWGGQVGKGLMDDPNNQQSAVNNGLSIPLWKHGVDPFVYPKPHVVLKVAVDPNTGVATQSQEIDEPEKLCFYSTESAGANPDAWLAVPNVDYTDVLPPRTSQPKYRLSTSPGLGAFTWKLLPGSFAANVVSQRSPSAMSARLSNVSMMRSQATQGSPSTSPPLAALKEIPDRVSSIFNEVATQWSNTSSLATILKQTDLGSYFSDLSASAKDAFTGVQVNVAQITSACKSNLDQLTSGAADLLVQVKQAVKAAVDSNGIKAAAALLDSPIAKINIDPATIQNAHTQWATLVSQLNTAIGSPPPSDLNSLLQVQQLVTGRLTPFLTSQLTPFQLLSGTPFAPGWTYLATLESRLAGPIATLINGATPAATDITKALQALNDDVTALSSTIQALSTTLPATLTLDPFHPSLASAANDGDLAAAIKWADNVDDTVTAAVENNVTTAVNAVQASLNTWINNNVTSLIPSGAAVAIQTALTTVNGALQDVLLAREAMTDFQSQLADLQTSFQSTVQSFLDAGKVFSGSTLTSNILGAGSQELSLLRAFGAPPVASGLGFQLPVAGTEIVQSLDGLAYFFDSTVPNVPITDGVQSVLQKAASQLGNLSPVSLTVPVQSLLDQLQLPDADTLKQMAFAGLGGIFQNLAGMDFGSLFSGLIPPLNTPNCIHISHSINPQTLQVEVKANIDLPFGSDVDVFSEGPIYLRLLNPEFTATILFEAGAGQQTVEQVNGAITGNWEMQIAGLSLITFVNTSLTFDQGGHIHFNVSPEKVQLASVMQFVADLINSFIPSGSGLTIAFNTAPVAVTCNLDLPLPDIAAGTFAISNVRLGALFAIGFNSDNQFQFKLGMNLSKMEAPFAIVVFILGGGGWVNAQLTYAPGDGRTPVVSVQIGISAIAALEIALGPISGGVMISFSLFATYSTGSSLDLGIVIVVAGYVSLLDIVEADITLMLEADYAGGQLTGRGSVDVEIKICWCFTLSIHEEVEYSFGNASSGQQQQRGGFLEQRLEVQAIASDAFWNAASDYIDVLAA